MPARSHLVTVLVVGSALMASVLPTTPNQSQKQQLSAVAVLSPTIGNKVSGVVKFGSVSAGVRVTGEVTGLPPNSKHGFHIHEFGDLTVKDGTSMGGHYNPMSVDHGLPSQRLRHAGDMGNITSDSKGVAKIDFTYAEVSIEGKNSVLGRGVIVHEQADDGGQPTGNAGARIACGVIGIAMRD